MYPQTHLIAGIFTGLILLKLNVLSLEYAILLVLFTVLIDIDHLIKFIIKTKSLNLKLLWKDTFSENKYVQRTWFHFKKGRVLMVLLTIFIMQLDFSLGLSIFIAYFLHMLIDDIAKKYIDHIKPKKKQNRLRVIVELFTDCILIIGIIILL